MKFLQKYPKRQNLYYLTLEKDDFEKAYLKVREQEGRLYSDEIVAQLPRLPQRHPHFKEWKMRQWNTERLLQYLQKKEAHSILDLGCGNGWLTHQIANRTNSQVLGVDINSTELIQANRLFSNDNCQFAYCDIFQEGLPAKYFDIIILDSCVQYFPNLNQLINRLQKFLKSNGEIHILDSPFYDEKMVEKARQRSQDYYLDRGEEKMKAHYFHHTWDALQQNTYKIIYQPDTFKNWLARKLFGRGTPFPWILIS
ncbi:class I SAM-dependent methyltransferase [Saprospiraceae bacterium]|nr:class I SAM-dependent methyltransferase [Saprospiraceae bacterium]